MPHAGVVLGRAQQDGNPRRARPEPGRGDAAQTERARRNDDTVLNGSHAPSPWTTRDPGSRRPRPRPALVTLLLLVPLLTGLFGAPVAPTVRGDELADARTDKKALQAQVASQKAEIDKLNADQAALKQEIAATRAALAGVNADLVAVRKRIESMIVRIDEVKRAYAVLVIQLNALDVELARVEAAERLKREELAERKAMLADRLRSAYDVKRTTLLETFLSNDSFTDVLAEMSYYVDVGEQDTALAQQIVSDQQTLAALHETVIAVRGQTDELRVKTAAQKKELDGQLADLKMAQAQLRELEKETRRALAAQKSAYDKLARNKAALARAVAASEAAIRKLETRIKAILAEQKRKRNIPSQYNGTLIWPVDGVISQEYGCTGFYMEPSRGSCPHFHSGIDIVAPKYTPIVAAGDGTVLFAGPNPYDPYPKAWIVIIAHSEDLISWYGHVDNAVKPPAVRAGETVRKGQVIAYVGNTGRSTGPHLHWMVEHQDAFKNPRLFL